MTALAASLAGVLGSAAVLLLSLIWSELRALRTELSGHGERLAAVEQALGLAGRR